MQSNQKKKVIRYCLTTFTLVTKKLIDHSKHLRELWFWGAENVNRTRTRFTGSFNWKTTFHSLWAFMFMFHVYQKAGTSECVCVRTCELSLIFCLMLHCIKCSVGFDANSTLLLLQSSPVYYHHLWNSKQLRESSIHLHTFPIPRRLHHSSPPSVTAFVPPAAQSRAPAAKG